MQRCFKSFETDVAAPVAGLAALRFSPRDFAAASREAAHRAAAIRRSGKRSASFDDLTCEVVAAAESDQPYSAVISRNGKTIACLPASNRFEAETALRCAMEAIAQARAQTD